MRLVTFRVRAAYPAIPRIGMLVPQGVLDVAAAYRCMLQTKEACEPQSAHRIADALLPSDMVLFLESGISARRALDAAFAFVQAADFPTYPIDGELLVYPTSGVQVMAPLPRPRGLRDFLSFEQHIKNIRRLRGVAVPPEWYELPVYYKGSVATIIGPDEPVRFPLASRQLDYELELACVIGRRGSDIRPEEAEAYIAAYTIMNDFSARDIQFKEVLVGLGPAKGKDFATALGPAIVTVDELPDPYNLTMIARVNGEEWSRGNSGTIYRRFPEMIAYASAGEVLLPGDVLGSGTVGLGCGAELGRYLQDGDVVELEIEGLGRLSNRVVHH